MSGPAVTMRRAQFNAYEVQLSMAHARFSDDFLSEPSNVLHGAFQHHRLQTLVMIQMRVHS